MLIVDDDRRMTQTLADIIELSGYRALQAFSADQALSMVKEKKPDCVITDVRMPGMSGVELFREVYTLHPQLPVVLMTAYASNEQIQLALEEGAMGALTKPIAITYLLDFLALLAKERVLALVDDDPSFIRTLAEILEKRGFCVKRESDPHKALQTVTQEVGILLLDMKLNSVDGSQVVEVIRASFPDLPILLITGYRREMRDAIHKALESNAFACLYKPLEIPRLLEILENVWQERMKKTLRGEMNADKKV